MTDKPPRLIWTYTLLDAYENCNYKGFRKYLAPDEQRVPYVEGKAQAWGNHNHTAFEKRINHGEPLPADMAHHEIVMKQLEMHYPIAEQKLGIRADRRPCPFFDCGDGDGRGKIDLTIMKDTTAFILDYKTNAKPREDRRELAIQALLLKAKFPHLTKIIGRYFWLTPNRLGTEHDVSDTDATWRRVQGIVANIREKMAANWWPKNENPLCPWCEVPNNDCEFRRPIPNK